MADPRRFGRSERQYSGVPRRGLSKYNRFGGSERTFTGVTDRTGNKYRRFGPSEKEYTERRYTPMGQGTTWGFTGEKRRKILGYDVGARPPRGLDYLISREGIMGQDPRSTTYGAPWDYWQTDPDDLRGYRASVADVAAANAAEERERIAIETAGEFLPAPTIPYQYKGRYETPGEIGEGYDMLREDSPLIKANVGWPSIGEREAFRSPAKASVFEAALPDAQQVAPGDYTPGDPTGFDTTPITPGLVDDVNNPDYAYKWDRYNPRQPGLDEQLMQDYEPPTPRWGKFANYIRNLIGQNRGGLASLPYAR